MSHAPASSGRHHRAAHRLLLVFAAAIAVSGGLDVARGHLHTGVSEFLMAAMVVVGALLIRLNWRLIEVNRSLISQNAELLFELAAQEDPLPQWLREFN